MKQHLMGTVHEGIGADIDRYQTLILILIFDIDDQPAESIRSAKTGYNTIQ